MKVYQKPELRMLAITTNNIIALSEKPGTITNETDIRTREEEGDDAWPSMPTFEEW